MFRKESDIVDFNNFVLTENAKNYSDKLKANFDFDPLCNYLSMVDELEFADNKADWIDEEINQIAIDVENASTSKRTLSLFDVVNSRDWKTFRKMFDKEFVGQPNYQDAVDMFNQLETKF